MAYSKISCTAGLLAVLTSACLGAVHEGERADGHEQPLRQDLTGHYVFVPLPGTCEQFATLTFAADGRYRAVRPGGAVEQGTFVMSDELDQLMLAPDEGDSAVYGLKLADGAMQISAEACNEVLELSSSATCTDDHDCAEGTVCDIALSACVARPGRLTEPSDPTPCAERTGGAVVTFDVHGEELRVWSTNASFIAEARTLIGREGFQRTPVFNAMRVGYDDCAGRTWSLDPADMHFDDLTTEVCDAVPSYVDANRDGWLAAPGNYCPWGPRVVAVEPLR